MIYNRVDKIDIEFSAIGFGCWGASGPSSWTGHDDKEQIKAMHAAIDGGVNFFDVAPVYGLGHAEKVLGEAIKNRRDKVVVASKCGLIWDDQGNVTNNCSEASILKEIDQSLERLSTDYIDIYQVHWPSDNGVPIEETIETLNKIKKQGKIRYIGLSNFSVELAKEAMKYGDISSMQGLYNMIERNAESYHNINLTYKTEEEIFPLVQQSGMAFFPYSPLLQGFLSGNFKSRNNFDLKDVRNSNPRLIGDEFKEIFKMVNELKSVSEEIGKPLYELALKWLMEKRQVTSIIAGVKNADQVAANLKSTEWEMPKSIKSQINEIMKLRA